MHRGMPAPFIVLIWLRHKAVKAQRIRVASISFEPGQPCRSTFRFTKSFLEIPVGMLPIMWNTASPDQFRLEKFPYDKKLLPGKEVLPFGRAVRPKQQFVRGNFK